MIHGELTVMLDPVADSLDDLAALGLHWARNRERGRMPSSIRQAMLLVAREMLLMADAEEQDIQRRLRDVLGSAQHPTGGET